MKVFCGIDWSERHHDVAVVDEAGTLVARARIGDNAGGFADLLELLGAAGDSPESLVPVALETPRGLLVAALRATGRPVYAINPMAAARYRDRHSVARAKSDHADAVMLANILRTDAPAHRTLPADSEAAQAVGVLARAQQDAVWHRTRIANELRSLLREYYPAFLTLFAGKPSGVADPVARAVLAVASTPAAAARCSRPRFAAALRRAGRKRGIDGSVETIRAGLRAPALRQPGGVEEAFGRQALALLGILDAACRAADDLADATREAFAAHPDHQVITSFPGLGDLLGARVLAEIGDDRTRFPEARNLKAYAGSSPVTRASGRSRTVVHRRVKNQRLASAGHLWAFGSLTSSAGARAHYDRRRGGGDRHNAASRHLFNRLLGTLHHCLATGQTYDEQRAFPPPRMEDAA
ncbi:IS110 family transposase [Parafrankia sp. BMG5.11]|uniref:IS110 family transposase n=1 Tax=Parafrankia sp. BMG5.11 TaxID=222540 RepID=UPI001039D533|nr:IS110 family transposase [Parafrankia sp. BMG5.11]TCJ31468.1 IS110 family transposase [Parafrankia sp. BMG5.11]